MVMPISKSICAKIILSEDKNTKQKFCRHTTKPCSANTCQISHVNTVKMKQSRTFKLKTKSLEKHPQKWQTKYRTYVYIQPAKIISGAVLHLLQEDPDVPLRGGGSMMLQMWWNTKMVTESDSRLRWVRGKTYLPPTSLQSPQKTQKTNKRRT